LDLKAYLADRRQRVESAIEEALPPRHPDAGRLVEAMRYTLLLPGKRLRGIVCLAVSEAWGGREKDVLPLAVAVEMIHASSLILDDLPAFDNALRRRGAPTNHRVFGEATAILAAVSLLSGAYRHVARCSRPRMMGPDDAVGTVQQLAEAVGENGMVAGEALDLLARGAAPGFEELERIHALKTGSLFIACAIEAGRRAGAGATEQAALKAYAKNLGLAFQITDDLLDVVGDPEKTGKDVGLDEAGASFVTFAGVEGARQLALDLLDTAARSLGPIGRRGDVLEAIARSVATRER
jgi:geranylgeranyl diphosphate synthase type II